MSYEDSLLAHIMGGASRPMSAGEAAAVVTFMQDSYGVGLSGSRVDLLPAVKAACLAGGQDARVWGTGEAGDAASAALVNAYQIHNQEWDCVHEPAVVHPLAVVLAALTAVAERAGGVSGDLLLRAVSTGVDVATVLGMCAGQPMRFFRPGWCGGLGAVAGLAVLCGADERQTRNALGLVYSALGGTMQAHVEGSMALPLQVAFSARNAVTALDLAMNGIDGPQTWLTGDYGFFRQIESDDHAAAAFALLGVEAQITRVSHKPFPTGRAAHGGLDGLQQLLQVQGFGAEQVASVTLAAPPLILRLVGREPHPEMTAGYARLCFPWLAATMLLTGDVAVEDFQPARLADSRRLDLAGRVKVVLDGNPDPNAMAPQALTVRLEDGSELRCELPAVLGSPERPLCPAAHREKFTKAVASAARPFSAARAERLFDAIAGLSSVTDAVAKDSSTTDALATGALAKEAATGTRETSTNSVSSLLASDVED